jgi:hypothetical protein
MVSFESIMLERKETYLINIVPNLITRFQVFVSSKDPIEIASVVLLELWRFHGGAIAMSRVGKTPERNMIFPQSHSIAQHSKLLKNNESNLSTIGTRNREYVTRALLILSWILMEPLIQGKCEHVY